MSDPPRAIAGGLTEHADAGPWIVWGRLPDFFPARKLITALFHSSPSIHLTTTNLTTPPIPPESVSHAFRVTAVQTDLTSPEAVTSLLAHHSFFNAIYLLHGIVSGGAEANLDLGMRVNLDSHRFVLNALHQETSPHRGTVVVFPSSLAIYGPAAPGQTLLGDYSRRGLLDGRIVRLPTIIVRPRAPGVAASSFASGIVRESLKGEENVLLVRPELAMWVCSPKTVVGNLVAVKDIHRNHFGLSRVVNLLGVTVTVADILDALEAVGGKGALNLVREERNPQVEAIVESWPAFFDVSKALSLGLAQDGDLVTTIKDFATRLKAGL
ncbi:putative nucleoside-diphosphate-sugar epimerase [Colletotrichum somersetense]|nr:putative nucleoside-diphosphate-sugar epimerase [Colletotrichum somersetense]